VGRRARRGLAGGAARLLNATLTSHLAEREAAEVVAVDVAAAAARAG